MSYSSDPWFVARIAFRAFDSHERPPASVILPSMRFPFPPLKPFCTRGARIGRRALCLFVLLSAGVPVAQARELRLEVERLSQGEGAAAVEAGGLRLVLRAAEQPGAGLGLRLRAQRLYFAGLGYDFRSLDWRCELRPRDVDSWRCSGPLRADGQAAGELSLDWKGGGLELELARARTRVQAVMPGDSDALSLQLERLPSAWLQPLLAQAWPQARFTDGTWGGELELDTGLDAPRLEGELRADALGLDTLDGSIATAGLNLKGSLGLEFGERTRVGARLGMSGGELLLGPLYAELPVQPVQLDLAALGAGAGWQIEQLRWSDAATLQLEASARVDLAAADPLPELQLQLQSQDARLLVQRYLQSLLATQGLPDARAEGGLRLQLRKQDAELSEVQLETDALAFADAGGRLQLQGVDGRLGWTRATPALEGSIAWSALSVFGLQLQSATLDWRSVAGELALAQPVEVGVLGGTLLLDTLAWRPQTSLLSPASVGLAPVPDASQDADTASQRLRLSARLQGLQLSALSALAGWPAFEGELSGEIPGVRYTDGVLRLDGTLGLQVFDGEVAVSGLAVERLFGVAPTLAADIELRHLNLQPLTQVFGFGEITGRMNGYIRGLRLLDWAPVAFDARFDTDPTAREPRRISQRAVRDLSSVGGMGAAAALQQGVLRAFETFAYARIGIGCRLANDVCHMQGIERTARGYSLVEGSGLPRISVNGVQRQVDWPVLVARLKAVSEGQRPTVE